MTTTNEKIISLKSKISQAENNIMYADSHQAEQNQQRDIDAMKTKLKNLEDDNNE